MANGNQTEDMLATDAAARLMGCSRVDVAMMIDAQLLDGGMKTEHGDRRVPLTSVQRWIREAQDLSGDADYSKAGVDAGMYLIPDEVYTTHTLKSHQAR